MHKILNLAKQLNMMHLKQKTALLRFFVCHLTSTSRWHFCYWHQYIVYIRIFKLRLKARG